MYKRWSRAHACTLLTYIQDHLTKLRHPAPTFHRTSPSLHDKPPAVYLQRSCIAIYRVRGGESPLWLNFDWTFRSGLVIPPPILHRCNHLSLVTTVHSGGGGHGPGPRSQKAIWLSSSSTQNIKELLQHSAAGHRRTMTRGTYRWRRFFTR
jgi:hypothetical protein